MKSIFSFKISYAASVLGVTDGVVYSWIVGNEPPSIILVTTEIEDHIKSISSNEPLII